MQGWIKLQRKIQNHWIYQEKRVFSRYEAWLDLIMMANHKDNKVLIDGKLKDVARGEFVTSIRKLCDRWDWSNTKVTTFLKLLESDEMIAYKSDTKKTVVTIVNYGLYHDREVEETTQKRHRNVSETYQKHTNKNDKNVKNDKEVKNSRKQVYDETSLYYKMTDYFYKLILKNNPQHKKPNYQRWSDDFRKLVELDKRDKDQVRKVMEFVQADDFEMKNVLSPGKLRDRYDQLFMKANQSKENNFVKPKYEVVEGGKGNDKHTEKGGHVQLFR